MKDGFKHIIGKQIAAVVVARSDRRNPRHQVFLVFPDGTRFELYGDHITCCGGVDKAAGIAEYVEAGGGEVVSVYGDASVLEPARARVAAGGGESLEGLLTRDLNAWTEAKAAIERAKGRG
jgi:hypothetical protein